MTFLLMGTTSCFRGDILPTVTKLKEAPRRIGGKLVTWRRSLECTYYLFHSFFSGASGAVP